MIEFVIRIAPQKKECKVCKRLMLKGDTQLREATSQYQSHYNYHYFCKDCGVLRLTTLTQQLLEIRNTLERR